MKDAVWDALATALGYGSIKALLQDKYIDQQKSASAVAKELGCSDSTIFNLLDVSGLKKRTKLAKKPTIPKKDLINVPLRDLAKTHGISRSKAWRMRNKTKGTSP